MKRRKGYLLCLVLLLLCLLPLPAQAASKKSKALKAYRNFLSGEKVAWDVGVSSYKVSASQCYFALAYVDGDSVPELIIYNDSGEVPHIAGYGRMFTYRGGKLKSVASLDMNKGRQLTYYKKKGIFTDIYVGSGIVRTAYKRLSGASVKTEILQFKSLMSKTKGYTQYVDGTAKSITKKAFNSARKQLIKGAKKTNAAFYSNTAANRSKYLK